MNFHEPSYTLGHSMVLRSPWAYNFNHAFQRSQYLLIIDGIHVFLFIDWLKVYHVIKYKLTILQKLRQSRSHL